MPFPVPDRLTVLKGARVGVNVAGSRCKPAVPVVIGVFVVIVLTVTVTLMTADSFKCCTIASAKASVSFRRKGFPLFGGLNVASTLL